MNVSENEAARDAQAPPTPKPTPVRDRSGGALRRMAITLAVAMPVALAIIVTAAWVFQGRLLYPRTSAQGTPAGWTRVDLGGGRAGYWRGPTRVDARTLLFVHGENMDATAITQATAGWRDAGYGVLAPEYPGYAGTPGDPTPASIEDATMRGVAWLERRGVRGPRLVIEGQSFGAGAAIRAASRPHQALVVVSGVASLADVARHRYGPFGALLRHDQENEAAMSKVKGHVIVTHGAADRMTPYEQGERLARAARVPLIALPIGHEAALDAGLQTQLALSVERRARR